MNKKGNETEQQDIINKTDYTVFFFSKTFEGKTFETFPYLKRKMQKMCCIKGVLKSKLAIFWHIYKVISNCKYIKLVGIWIFNDMKSNNISHFTLMVVFFREKNEKVPVSSRFWDIFPSKLLTFWHISDLSFDSIC